MKGKELQPKGKGIDENIVEKFKWLIIEMHRGIPQFYYFGFLEELMPDEEIRDYFFKEGIFIKSKTKTLEGQDKYFLGVKGINLANSYETELLSKKMMGLTSQIKWLTVAVVILTVLLALPALWSIVKFFI